MGAWGKLSCGVLGLSLITCGCAGQAAKPMTFQKPETKPLVIRTGPIPAKPMPAAPVAPPAGAASVFLAPTGLITTSKAEPAKPVDPNAWIGEMKKVHAAFAGTKGYVALLGDSITFADAFWTPLDYCDISQFLVKDDGLPKNPAGGVWKDAILGKKNKGLDHCNGSGWQVGYILRVIDAMLMREKPEAAILMVGTNDSGINQVAPGWQQQYEKIVVKCLEAKCVPILNTIPPRIGKEQTIAEFNVIIRAVAAKYSVPLVDYHAELVRRRPGDSIWGTLMQKDGVHPSAGKTTDFSEANLNESGYALRTWMNFHAYRELYFRVLNLEQMETVKAVQR